MFTKEIWLHIITLAVGIGISYGILKAEVDQLRQDNQNIRREINAEDITSRLVRLETKVDLIINDHIIDNPKKSK